MSLLLILWLDFLRLLNRLFEVISGSLVHFTYWLQLFVQLCLDLCHGSKLLVKDVFLEFLIPLLEVDQGIGILSNIQFNIINLLRLFFLFSSLRLQDTYFESGHVFVYYWLVYSEELSFKLTEFFVALDSLSHDGCNRWVHFRSLIEIGVFLINIPIHLLVA